MDVTPTAIPGVLVLEPRVHADERGRFLETWRRDAYARLGLPAEFVQDNVARSKRSVLRGLHYQLPGLQGKLVMALEGEVFDVAVDIRTGSPTFGEWVGERISAENARQLWVPEGFAHGYVVLSDTALVAYKCTRTYQPGGDRAISWKDPDLAIDWPVHDPILSPKDGAAPRLSEVPPESLPPYRPEAIPDPSG